MVLTYLRKGLSRHLVQKVEGHFKLGLFIPKLQPQTFQPRTFQPWAFQPQTFQPKTRLFIHEIFNPRLLKPGLSNPKSGVKKSGVEKFMLERSWVERSGDEMSFKLIVRLHFNPWLFTPDLSTPDFWTFQPRSLKSLGLRSLGLKISWLESLGLESSLLKSPGLKGLGLKLGVEKSGVEMSFNRFPNFIFYMCVVLWWTLSFVSFCTVSINVFILLIAIPLATFSESQWGIEDNREDSNCDKTNNKGEVSEQLIKMFLKDLPSVAWANLSSAVFDIATATIVTIMCCNDELSWTMSWVGCLITD